jgi:hypothetical protein
MKPHKHAELIKQWADGAVIEACVGPDEWEVEECPDWHPLVAYRIKPEPEPDLVYYGCFDKPFGFRVNSEFNQQHNKGDQIKITFDGTTKKIKSAEVLK